MIYSVQRSIYILGVGMGYDLVIRANRNHTSYAEIGAIQGYLRILGFKPTADSQWIHDHKSWIELYLGTVAEGPGGGDRIDADSSCFNQISLHPKPLTLDAIAKAHGIAAMLGWDLYNPQLGISWREAGIALQPVTPKNREPLIPIETLATDWHEHYLSLHELSDANWLMGYKASHRSSQQGIEIRSGSDWSKLYSLDTARSPAKGSPDGRWIATSDPFGSRLQTIDRVNGESKTWPARTAFEWLPDYPGALLCVTLGGKQEHRVSEEYPARSQKELACPEWMGNEYPQLFILDLTTSSPTPLQPTEIFGQFRYNQGTAAVSGTGETAFFGTGTYLYAFSLSTGEFMWRERLGEYPENWDEIAASHCGNMVAVGGVKGLQVFEAGTGRIELTMDHFGSGISALAFHPSGWLAVGLGNGQIHRIFMDGATDSSQCLRGAVKAISFTKDGQTLIAAGTHPGAVRFRIGFESGCFETNIQTINSKEKSPRKLKIVAWNFSKKALNLSTEPVDILELEPLEAARRLSELENFQSLIPTLLQDLSNRKSDSYWEKKSLALVLAVALRTHNTTGTENDAYVPELLWDVISQLACRISKNDRTGAMFSGMKTIVDALPLERRMEIILAYREQPVWSRFYLLPPSKELAEFVVEMIQSWPKNIFTQLKKSVYAPHMRWYNGETAKEFWSDALDLLKYLGKDAEPALREAIKDTTAHKALFKKAIDALEAAAKREVAEDTHEFTDGHAAYAAGDHESAYRLFRNTAVQNDVESQFRLGLLYAQGEGVNRDTMEAVRWYRMAAEGDHIEAQLALASCLERGAVDLPSDISEAVKWYTVAANKNEPRAMLRLGLLHSFGNGVEKSQGKYLQLYKQAAELGLLEAQKGLAFHYTLPLYYNPEEAVQWHRMAAMQGDAESQYNIGEAYRLGRGVDKNGKEALHWLSLASEQGLASAYCAIGHLYDFGEGEPQGLIQNKAEAARWYRKSVAKKYPRAMVYLGQLYEQGEGVTKDLEEAISLYMNAARKGLSGAYYHLGLLYETGNLVPKNIVLAYALFLAALKQSPDNSMLRNSADNLAAILSGAERKTARSFSVNLLKSKRFDATMKAALNP